MTQKEFNEVVWNYGASGAKAYSDLELTEEQKQIIAQSWAENERALEGDDTTKNDTIIDSYYEDFVEA